MESLYKSFHFTLKEANYLESADVLIAKYQDQMDDLPYINSEKYKRDLETVYVRSASLADKDMEDLIKELKKKNVMFRNFEDETID